MKKEISKQIVKRVINAFDTKHEFIEALPYGSGHINETFIATYQPDDGSGRKRYIFQRINTDVFKDPYALMDNIVGVTTYLKEYIKKQGGDPERETLNVVKTKDGNNFYEDDEAGFWRCYDFVEDTITLQLIENPRDFYNSGRAFGKFQRVLADYPADTLNETIKDFHNTKVRYDNLMKAVQADVCGRAKDVQAEIEFAKARKEDTAILVDMLERGELPLRVTHNDTKLNNVLIDVNSGKCICVIDLDTVMPGLSVYDFGDSIRFGASTGAEDEVQLDKIWVDLELFEMFSKGFIKSAGNALTKQELLMLTMGAKLMTLECGMRFLTDHLSGDVYFKVHRDGHNLDRARTQFKLVSDMEQKWDSMNQIIANLIENI